MFVSLPREANAHFFFVFFNHHHHSIVNWISEKFSLSYDIQPSNVKVNTGSLSLLCIYSYPNPLNTQRCMPYEIGSLNFKPINFNSIILSKELRLNRLLASTAYSWLYVYSITLFKITFPFSLISKLQFILLVEGGKREKKN